MTTNPTPRNGDEENGNDRNEAARWRNAYWARVREDEGTADPDNFGGQFRGVKPAPHGGAAHVRPDDTLGASELCWCGRPLDHMWPGRTVGSKHPSEEKMKTMTAHVDRRDLRAYHRTVQDFLIQCINHDQLRFRIAKNSVILYPPDGSQPQTVYARNSESQVRQLVKWYADHVQVEDDTPASGEPSPEQLERLAEATNDPTEHPREHPKREKRIRKVEDVELPDEQAAEEAPVAPDEQATEEAADDLLQRMAEDAHAQAEVEVPEEEQPAEEQPDTDGEWQPVIMGNRKPSPNIETNGTLYRCKWCLDTDHPMLSENPRSSGGHNRIYHTPGARETMHSPEARAKAVATRKEKMGIGKVEEAVALLNSVLGVQPVDTDRVAALEAENKALRKRAEDAEAKLALIREATGL